MSRSDKSCPDVPLWDMFRCTVSVTLLFVIAACSQATKNPQSRNRDAQDPRDAIAMISDTSTSHYDANSLPPDSGESNRRDAADNNTRDSGETNLDAGNSMDAAKPPKDSGTIKDAEPKDAMIRDAQVNPRDTGVATGDAGANACNCTTREYCENTTQYSCSGIGRCQTRPQACNRILRPVCSCDKMDYPNECEANRAGKDIRHEGRCDCRDLGCPNNESCQACQTATQTVTYICLPAGVAC